MSAELETPSGYRTPEGVPDVGASTTSSLELEWQELPSCTASIKDNNWSARSAPAALDTYPENVVISDQLKQILFWSLQRLENTTDDQQSNEPVHNSAENAFESTHDSAESAPEPLGSMLLPQSSAIEATAVEVHDASLPASRPKSHRTLPLIARLHKLRQDVAAKMASAAPPKCPTTNSSQHSSSHGIIQEPILRGECISCFDEFPQRALVHLDCSHDYCKPCLREVVLNAMRNEAAFPPKCCLFEVPLKKILLCLESQQRDEYRVKAAEYAIPAGHRWYCPEPTCSRWIRPENLQNERRKPQTCPYCTAAICSMCRSLSHDINQDCPQDFGLESTLEIAESEGWRRCYSCRTMVELTTGCRHITCRCGAEFCYVCNARWRTCNCTETDKERRIQELRARRAERAQAEEEERRRREEEDEAARVEAEEMAEAIRQVEELERQEATRRAEEERIRQLEEELALARLEEERLMEEIARREAEEEAERQFREILITSSKQECQIMMKKLIEIVDYQHATLMSDHATQEQNTSEGYEVRKFQQTSQSNTELGWLQENISHRVKALDAKERSEWEALLQQNELEEDEMFMEMHMHLRGKPNREQREKRMRDAFHKQYQEKMDRLRHQHQLERQRHEMGVCYEMEGLRKAASVRLEALDREYSANLENLGTRVGCDRKWFQVVSTRRINMLDRNTTIVLQQLKAQEEPIGLTEEQARSVEPILPALVNSTTVPSGFEGALEGIVHNQEQEEADLYGPGLDGRSSIRAPSELNTLNRSNTKIRTAPDTDPVLTVTSSEHPTSLSTEALSTRMNLNLPTDRADQSSVPVSTAVFELPATTTNLTTTDASLAMTKHLSTDTQYSTSSSHSASSTSSDSSNTNTSTSSGMSTSTSTSPSLHDHSPHTNAYVLHRSLRSAPSQASVEVAGTGTATAKGKEKQHRITGLFRSHHKKKEISEEEIRRRMSKAVFGDSLGGGWGAFG